MDRGKSSPASGSRFGVRVLEGGDAIPGILDLDDVRLWPFPNGDGVEGFERDAMEVGDSGGGRGAGSAV